MDTKFLRRYVLRPHWPRLSAAFAAVCIIGLTDVLEPWPIKVVLDYVVGSKQMPEGISVFVARTFGGNKMAILHFAVALVIAIAAAGALASYLEKTLTSSYGQAVPEARTQEQAK